ncbi:Aldehyde dehydrogenase [Parafrankia sp. Ea1.12]|uniref:proline dehydrogenase family protein n=1 Tax=Parafrankia sp. Ea1.12 TaxID=573499 RepID=UPI000DA5781E|nr:proline dehydrogenase family protein [Parafrankia sp. Ea1.12]SQD95442.1 Aldehyde dehydrogenase [Parafrankia sp. Ea1.12]
MTAAVSSSPHDLSDLGDEAVALVRRWVAEAASEPVDPAAARLAAVLREPGGLAFTVRFVDGVIRPEDPRVAARNLARLAPSVPAFLPWYLRGAVRAGGAAGPVVPWVVVPAARRVLRRMVGHLVVDATDRGLGRAIERLRRPGVQLNMNLLGEAVLGEREAARRLAGTTALLARDDVDHVSIKVSASVAPHAPWAFEETVAHVVETLTPLFEQATAARPAESRPAESRPATFVTLDMEEYRDLDLTIEVFTTLLDRPALRRLAAGIVLQAYLPDALGALTRLQEWSASRRAAGGAPVTVRLVKGANLPMERAEASLRGWPPAPYDTKQDTDANYKRLLDYALHPDRVANVRVGVAGHNLFDLAFAWLLAGRRGARGGLRFEMLLGMAQAQARVVAREVGGLLLYTPVVRPAEFDVAIAYLVRRLEEGASRENFMSAVFDLATDETLFAREEKRFRASLADVDDTVPSPRRTQNRLRAAPPIGAAGPAGPDGAGGFRNAPDTDPSLAANRTWARRVLARVPASTLGVDLVAATTIRSADELDAVLARAVAAGPGWAALGGAGRAAVLRRAAEVLEQRRGELVEVMATETAKTFDQADPEVSEAVDFARYYAERGAGLDDVDGALLAPVRLTVVTPPWNFPVAIPAGSTLAALAAGSPVVIKPAGQARRCGAVLVRALWDAGIPREVLQLVNVDEGDLGRALVGDPRVDRVILTGAFETAELFRSFRRDLPLLAETSGKNAIVVTPSADPDLAVRDVVASAFGHAGQKCSAASLLILVGSAAASRRLRDQLVDAVRSLVVGESADPRTQLGPLIEPASGKLLRALTELGPGERWLVEPRRLDEQGRLWSPGVRAGVSRGSEFHRTEYFGPVLGIMEAVDLAEAVEIQNEVDFGLTAGLHSLDAAELDYWLRHVQAGNLYVNRGITGAIVGRQPFGGWKRSAVGPGTKTGGPTYLYALAGWTSRPSSATAELGPAARRLLAVVADSDCVGESGDGASVGGASASDASAGGASAGGAAPGGGAGGGVGAVADLAGLERALRSDAAAWAGGYGAARELAGLSAERNMLRYQPVLVEIRFAGGGIHQLVRVVAAGLLAGSPLRVSSAVELPRWLRAELAGLAVGNSCQSDDEWLADLARRPASRAGLRVRLIGGDAGALTAAVGDRLEIAVHARPVTESGRLELLPFLREQAVSITAHRFGTPDGLSDGLL